LRVVCVVWQFSYIVILWLSLDIDRDFFSDFGVFHTMFLCFDCVPLFSLCRSFQHLVSEPWFSLVGERELDLVLHLVIGCEFTLVEEIFEFQEWVVKSHIAYELVKCYIYKRGGQLTCYLKVLDAILSLFYSLGALSHY